MLFQDRHVDLVAKAGLPWRRSFVLRARDQRILTPDAITAVVVDDAIVESGDSPWGTTEMTTSVTDRVVTLTLSEIQTAVLTPNVPLDFEVLVLADGDEGRALHGTLTVLPRYADRPEV